VGQIPDDVVTDMASIAPMLALLGYDPAANPPAYGVSEGDRQPEAPEQQQQEQYDTSVVVDGEEDTKRRPDTGRRRRRRRRR